MVPTRTLLRDARASPAWYDAERAGGTESRGAVSVGERALAAVGGDRQLDIYHSQWAGSHDRLGAVLGAAGDPLEALAGADWVYRGRCAPAAFPRQIDRLETSAVYLVSTRGVRVSLPVWLGFSPPDGGRASGVFVRVHTLRECCHLRHTVQFLKSLFHEAIGLAWLDSATARDLLALALRLYCTPERLHTPGTPL